MPVLLVRVLLRTLMVVFTLTSLACSVLGGVTESDLERRHGLRFFRGQPFTGYAAEFDNAGQQRLRVHFRQGLMDGQRTTWFANGQRATSEVYRHGQKVGIHTGWYPGGSRRFRYQFSDGQFYGDQWEWYASGQVYRVMHYVDGRERGQKIWRRSGQIYANYVAVNQKKLGLLGGRLCDYPSGPPKP